MRRRIPLCSSGARCPFALRAHCRVLVSLVVPAYGPQGLQAPQRYRRLVLAKTEPARCADGRASFTVGEVVPGAPALPAEGVGTAWACWQATGNAAVRALAGATWAGG